MSPPEPGPVPGSPWGAAALILAAGMGDRVGLGHPKAFISLAGRSILSRAAEAAAACPAVASLVVTVPAGYEEEARAMLDVAKPVTVVAGGADRQASVRRGLAEVPEGVEVVVCHDAARPFASSQLFGEVLAGLAGADGAIPAVPVPDTVKRVRDGFVAATETRDDLALAQTPQAFAAPALRGAHRRATEAGLSFTDDAALMEWAGFRVRVVPGEPGNFKITTVEDLARAEAALTGPGKEWVGGR